MSNEVKRFSPEYCEAGGVGWAEMQEDAEGAWCKASDYDALAAELEAARKQEPIGYAGLNHSRSRLYQHDGMIAVNLEPSAFYHIPVYALPPLAGQVRKRDASRAAIEKLRAMSHDELLAEVEALLATPSMEVKHGD